MTPVFADTSFYAACLMPRDAHHAKAVSFSKNVRSTIVTTDFVVIELVNFFSGTNGRTVVANFVRSLRADPNTAILPPTSDLLQRGFELFSKRPDKEWSLTDCISFVAMSDRGITMALTSDGHFEQAGFTMLL